MAGKLPSGIAAALPGGLPLDITFVDKNDVIRYYSDYRIFKRTPGVIGTAVQECHKPENRPAVNKVIADLRSGHAKVIEQTSHKDGRPVRVCYVAVHDSRGNYMGMVETCQWVDGNGSP